MNGSGKDPLGGWWLTAVIAALLLAMTAAIAATKGSEVEGTRLVIRMTARTSLALFLSAFTASTMVRLFPAPVTRWQRANRRYLGVSFAISHLIHGLAIIRLALIDPPLFDQLTNVVSFIAGGLGFAVIALLTATSFDRTARALGHKGWMWLHRIGVWYLWLSFTVNFAKRIPGYQGYWFPVALLLLALGLRIWAWRRSSSLGLTGARA